VKARHIQPRDLAGKVIDAHAHIGVTLKGYACREYPYAQTIEGLYYRQLAAGVDVNIVFPFTPDLYFDPQALTRGVMQPAAQPLSPVPYATENELLLNEVFDFCPELQQRFIPFVSVDPGREVDGQMRSLMGLEERYPIYGIKISPVLCQSSITELLGAGRLFLDYAKERDLPLLLHVTTDPREVYSQAADAFRVIAAYPGLRFCLAHCILFHKDFLQHADEAPNVWVDTAALKIQVELVAASNPPVSPPDRRIAANYTDHVAMMRTLVEAYPDTIIWGSDAPAYAYICRRQQADGVFTEFRLKARYEDEKAALDALPPALRLKACNTNTQAFLFG
jgi:predicted TIM-barrel fold metal-dependent hydrolase